MAKAKKKAGYPTGSQFIRARGLKQVVAAVRPDVHRAVTLAAALADPRLSVLQWAALAVEQAARAALDKAGLPWPETGSVQTL